MRYARGLHEDAPIAKTRHMTNGNAINQGFEDKRWGAAEVVVQSLTVPFRVAA